MENTIRNDLPPFEFSEPTEPEMHSAFRQELKRLVDDRLPMDERRSAAQRIADDFPAHIQSKFVDEIGRIVCV
jgi:hypothetical protein